MSTLMSTPNDLEDTPAYLDLTNHVKYETGEVIDAGHGHVCKGILTYSQGTANAVRLLLSSHCGGSVVTHTPPGCSEGHHGDG